MANEYQKALENVRYGIYGSEEKGMERVAKEFGKPLNQVKKDLKTIDGKIREE